MNLKATAMQRLRGRVWSLLASGLITAAATPGAALAAGGQGNSYCSNATGPDSGVELFFAGRYGVFSNPGDVVSSLIGILWGQGVGAPARPPGGITSTICGGSRP